MGMDRSDRGGMAAVSRGRGVLLLGAVAVVGCGRLDGFGGPAPPLATFTLAVGAAVPSTAGALRAALLWGAQWQTEPFCILPAESDAAAAVIAAGCRDPFGFVPLRVAANAPVTIGEASALTLVDLPSADVMVGDVTARVAYGSLVVYEDRDGDGTLQLARPHRTASGGDEGRPDDAMDSSDVVHGASFVTMTAPDQRVAFREGAFVASAFYPRQGCGDPPPRFSVLSAGGFAAADALVAAAMNRLPAEDPVTCAEAAPQDAVVHIPLQDPASVREVACTERSDDSSIRYREPPRDAPDVSDRVTACAHLPSFDAGNQPGLVQWVVSGRARDRCKGLTHYTLRGCRENVACPVPDWDYTATPPAWWPCPQ
jgi:hypothetical protein